MKKIVTSLLALTLAIVSVNAQTTENKVEHHRHHHGQAFRKLDLTSDQKTAIKGIREEFHKKLSDLKKQDGLTKEQLNSSRKELRTREREKMESVLTADQKSKLATMKTDWKEKRSANKKMITELNLTTDQKAKMKEIHTGFKSNIETIKNDQSLTQAQKREKIKDLAGKRKEEMKSILSPDQLSKWESIRKDRKEKETK